MKIERLLWALLLLALELRAQGIEVENVPLVSAPFQANAERLVIQTQRTQYETAYRQSEAICYARFAVSDCLRDARTIRRLAMDELRRQEVLLNDQERRAKAVQELDRIQENTSPFRQEEADLQRLQAQREQQERQIRADEKRLVQTKSISADAAKQVDAPHSAAEILMQQQRFEQKLQVARQHKLDKEKSLGGQSGAASKTLPVPSGF